VRHQHITKDSELREFCHSLVDVRVIAFDTEFVSEGNYRPELCLIQVATDEHLAVIDPLTIDDLTPFWSVLADGEHVSIAHAAREELRFCLDSVKKRPANLFDTQIAAGLVGLEYPASFANLVQKILGTALPKGETRTDWRRRPLSARQIDYALHDVIPLAPLFDDLSKRLQRLGRTTWLDDEMQQWQSGVEAYETQQVQWRRVKGIANLSSRSLAVLRELWIWRDDIARSRNSPAKRVLRDDLMVELAKIQSSDEARISSIRGLERRDLQRQLPQISAVIAKALALAKSECPPSARRKSSPQLTVLGQFLNTALSSICRAANLAPGIVGGVQDLRDLAAYRLNLDPQKSGEKPALAQGWRAEIVGCVIDDLLEGKTAIMIHDPLSDQPLKLAPREQ